MSDTLESKLDIHSDEFRARLLSDDQDSRYKAARQAIRFSEGVVDAALAWIQDQSPRLREMAAYMLGRVGHMAEEDGCCAQCGRTVPALVNVIEHDTNCRVRSIAAYALGHHADLSTIPALITAAGSPDAAVRQAAAYALGCYFGMEHEGDISSKPSVTQALLRLMDDSDDDTRDLAAFGLHQGMHDTSEVRARLWKALDDPVTDVRDEAVEALATFGDQSFAPRLERMFWEGDSLSPSYFIAAQELGNPALLPAVRHAEALWRETLEEGEEMHPTITDAVEALEAIAAESK